MGFVTRYFIKPFKHPLVQPPAGSFLVDHNGGISSSTLPASFSRDHIKFIGEKVLAMFNQASSIEIPLREVSVQYEGFKVQAKHLPSGALIYLIPRDRELGG